MRRCEIACPSSRLNGRADRTQPATEPGSFLRPTPSEPRLPVVACQMADRDVVERVGSMFGTTVNTIRRAGRRRMYGTRLKGSRAVLLMRDLAPAMGERRARTMSVILDAYSAPDRKLDFVPPPADRRHHVRR